MINLKSVQLISVIVKRVESFNILESKRLRTHYSSNTYIFFKKIN